MQAIESASSFFFTGASVILRIIIIRMPGIMLFQTANIGNDRNFYQYSPAYRGRTRSVLHKSLISYSRTVEVLDDCLI